MANQDQLDLLKQGTEIWNTWRKRYCPSQWWIIQSSLLSA
jgi:hypothetical protein